MWLAYVSISCASNASSDAPWRQMLHTRWFGLWSTLESTTVTDFLLLVRRTCSRSYSQSFTPPPDLFCSSHIGRPSDIMRRRLHWLEMPGLRQVQTVYAGIQMPVRTRSSLPVRSLHTRHGARSAEIVCDTCTIAVYHQDENHGVRSAWILLRFVRNLELTPSASAWPWSFVEQF